MTLLLVVYFLAGYQPLGERLKALDAPLKETGDKLSAMGISNVTFSALGKLDQRQHEIEASLGRLREARRHLEELTSFDAVLKARMSEPFQLVEYEIERQFRAEELERAARKHQVVLVSALMDAFPQYSEERVAPAVLWAQFYLMDQVLSVAIRNKVSSIDAVALATPMVHEVSGAKDLILDEISVRLEVSGNMDAVGQLLASLPVREDWPESRSIPELADSKPALFLDRLVLTKAGPENPDAVRAILRVNAFIFRKPGAEAAP